MASVTITSGGETQYGETVDHIIRRIWGDVAELHSLGRINDMVNVDCWAGMVVMDHPENSRRKKTLATIIYRPGDQPKEEN